ncbi:hypothetical protein L2E82_36422 [Cichorium intybus]|uniref:Uncharacterized protein n=1 Tax=Cichorium intybus TaxID=13427 RepID=A0ACB9BRH7_CICIN|nr:hypothetical protein L2E82_36422 [Cichorium intybus]
MLEVSSRNNNNASLDSSTGCSICHCNARSRRMYSEVEHHNVVLPLKQKTVIHYYNHVNGLALRLSLLSTGCRGLDVFLLVGGELEYQITIFTLCK